jgi:protein-S-isoprenylcysteine O-methyltransferase Ste14
MVKARSANLAALDGGGVRGGDLAPLLLDLQQHRQEHNPNGQHEEGPQAHTSGPYRWVRHPLYSVGSMFFASLSVLTANWFMALGTFSILLMLLVRLPKEKQKLMKRFGDEYREVYEAHRSLFP